MLPTADAADTPQADRHEPQPAVRPRWQPPSTCCYRSEPSRSSRPMLRMAMKNARSESGQSSPLSAFPLAARSNQSEQRIRPTFRGSILGSDSILMKFGLCLVLVHRGINAMQSVRTTTLIPRGFLADDAVNLCDRTLIVIRRGVPVPIGAIVL